MRMPIFKHSDTMFYKVSLSKVVSIMATRRLSIGPWLMVRGAQPCLLLPLFPITLSLSLSLSLSAAAFSSSSYFLVLKNGVSYDRDPAAE